MTYNLEQKTQLEKEANEMAKQQIAKLQSQKLEVAKVRMSTIKPPKISMELTRKTLKSRCYTMVSFFVSVTIGLKRGLTQQGFEGLLAHSRKMQPFFKECVKNGTCVQAFKKGLISQRMFMKMVDFANIDLELFKDVATDASTYLDFVNKALNLKNKEVKYNGR